MEISRSTMFFQMERIFGVTIRKYG